MRPFSVPRTAAPTVCAALCLLLLTACGPGSGRVRFKGTLHGVHQAEFYAYSEDAAFQGIDTIKILDGDFIYERPLAEPAILTLLYPNFTQTYVILEPGETVKMRGDAAKIGQAVLSGTDENALLSDFRLAQDARPEADRRLAAAQFVRDHAESLAAIAVFKQYFVLPAQVDAAEAFSLLDVLQKAQPASKIVRRLDESLRARLQVRAGSKLPDFDAVCLDGTPVSAASLRGKTAVLFFYATWMGDSHSTLRRYVTALRDNPEVAAVFVSLDYDREMLRRALRVDSLSESQVVCDCLAFESPIVARLGIRYLPTAVVVDRTGKIVEREVDLDRLSAILRRAKRK